MCTLVHFDHTHLLSPATPSLTSSSRLSSSIALSQSNFLAVLLTTLSSRSVFLFCLSQTYFLNPFSPTIINFPSLLLALLHTSQSWRVQSRQPGRAPPTLLLAIFKPVVLCTEQALRASTLSRPNHPSTRTTFFNLPAQDGLRTMR